MYATIERWQALCPLYGGCPLPVVSIVVGGANVIVWCDHIIFSAHIAGYGVSSKMWDIPFGTEMNVASRLSK